MSDFEEDDIRMDDGGGHEPMDGVEPTTTHTQVLPHHIPTEAELDAKYPHRPKNPNPTLPFHMLYTELFNPLLSNKKKVGVGGRGFRSLKPHEVRREIIERFIDLWKGKVGADVYPAFRLIMPDKDRDRTVYGLKEKSIGKMLVKLMKIGKTSEDALALLNWKLPGYASRGGGAVSSAGDFAGRCYEIIKKRPMRTTPGDLTVADVNEMLDRLSLSSKEEQQLPIFNEFYNNMNAEEMMWVIRMILKQMKVGATEKTFLVAWHPDAENLFNVSSSLKRVCWELHDPTVRLNSTETSVLLLSCFQPQLAQFQKRSFEDTVKVMQRGGSEQFWIEEKLDGERMQMHMTQGEFKWWSRKAKDYTYLYGAGEGIAIVEEGEAGDLGSGGSLVRYLKDAFDPGVKSIILDGEMITWDPVLDCIVAFGTLKTACLAQAKSPFDTTCNRPLFRVFDILHLNGESLLNYTLSDRRRALSASIRPIHRRLEIHEYTPATTAQEIEDSLRRVIAESSEGLVVKNPLSIYRLNERSDDWMKVKPDYMTEYGEDLDCLILGGYYGSGRRGGTLSSFLCGLRVDGNFRALGEPEHKFWSFCKVGGGFTAADYTKIQHMTRDKWEKFDPKRPPKDYVELAGGPLQFERPDEWIRPQDSLVIAVKAASVGPTDQFRTGKTLRFPRFKTFREDKDWRSALSVTEFTNLRAKVEKEHGEKMNVEKRIRGEGAGPRKKREVVVVGQEGEVKTPYGGPETMVFDGLAVFIITDSISPGYKKSKVELEQIVKANGGRFCQSEAAIPGVKTIGDKKTVKVSALIKSGKYDIIRPMWLLDSLEQYTKDKNADDAGSKNQLHLLPLEPKYLLHAREETESEAQGNVDEHGDSYCRDVDGKELQGLLESMSLHGLDLYRASEFREYLFRAPEERGAQTQAEGGEVSPEELMQLPGWTLAKCIAYIDVPREECGEEGGKEKEKEIPLSLQIAEQLLMFAGARISKYLYQKEVTHIIVDKNDLSRVKAIRKEFSERVLGSGRGGGNGEEGSEEIGRLPLVVEGGWVEECVKERTWVDEGRWVV